MTPLALALSLAASSPVPASVIGGPSFCEAAKAELSAEEGEGAEAWARFRDIASRFPEEAGPLVEYARDQAGKHGDVERARAILKLALFDGCPSGRPFPAATARLEVEAILADEERFFGTREQEDLLDRLLVTLGRWLRTLLESEAMQRYADVSQMVFLSLLGVFVAFVALRLWRARVRERSRATSKDAAEARVERERVRRFLEWRQEADERLSSGDLRGALRAGQMALLTRLGEVDRDAVTPARTNREILHHLDEEHRRLAEGPLRAFDLFFFGGRATREGVLRFLEDVDRAAAELSLGPTRRAA